MGRIQTVWKQVSFGVAVFLSLPAHVQAAPVNTIYAAENSLYGRGYAIGRADGWLDNDLRAAIKLFQSRSRELQTTGNLDRDTLKALGIAPAGEIITDNTLPSRTAAVAALGQETRASNPVVKRAPKARVAPQPTPTPQAKPESDLARTVADAEVKAEPTAGPEARKTVASKPEPATPVPVAKRKEPKPALASAEPTQPAVAEPQPAPSVAEPQPAATASSETPSPKTSATPATESNLAYKSSPEAPITSQQSDSTADQDTAATTKSTVAVQPEAPTPERRENPEETKGSSGGFLSWLFDFLFGWVA